MKRCQDKEELVPVPAAYPRVSISPADSFALQRQDPLAGSGTEEVDLVVGAIKRNETRLGTQWLSVVAEPPCDVRESMLRVASFFRALYPSQFQTGRVLIP